MIKKVKNPDNPHTELTQFKNADFFRQNIEPSFALRVFNMWLSKLGGSLDLESMLLLNDVAMHETESYDPDKNTTVPGVTYIQKYGIATKRVDGKVVIENSFPNCFKFNGSIDFNSGVNPDDVGGIVGILSYVDTVKSDGPIDAPREGLSNESQKKLTKEYYDRFFRDSVAETVAELQDTSHRRVIAVCPSLRILPHASEPVSATVRIGNTTHKLQLPQRYKVEIGFGSIYFVGSG